MVDYCIIQYYDDEDEIITYWYIYIHACASSFWCEFTVRNVILDLKIFSSNFTILLIVVA